MPRSTAQTTTHAQLHTGSPGAAGTDNVAAGVNRATCAFVAAAAKTSTANVQFVIPGAGGAYTHVSLWSAATGGVFNGSEALGAPETFANPGSLTVAVTVTGA